MRQFEYNSGVINKGIENCDDATLIDPQQFSDCQNIVIDPDGYPDKRKGIITEPDITNAGADAWRLCKNDALPLEPNYAKNLYTYRTRSGTEYMVAFVNGCVRYSTNLSDWTNILTGLNELYKVRFTTFKDKLIIANGNDNMYYWKSGMTTAVKIGAPILETLATGNMTAGVHKVKVTYEKAGDTANLYDYTVTNEITTDSTNKTITISGIPLGPELEGRADGTTATTGITVWISTAGTTTYYAAKTTQYLTTDEVLAGITFTLADADLDGNVAYDTYKATFTDGVVDVSPPRARFVEVFNNSLFAAFTNDAPSEIYKTEPENFEDFDYTQTLAINVDDGEYITGMINFRAMNMLIVFKKTSLYGIYPSADAYDFRGLGREGCTLDGSIQEFHIEDGNAARSTILYANYNGVFEFDGHSIRKISKQPGNGGSINNSWLTVKQRFAQNDSEILTKYDDFNKSGAFNLYPAGVANWGKADAGLNAITLTNVFDWYDSDAIMPNNITGNSINAMCWDATNKRLLTFETIDPGSSSRAVFSYTWSNTTKNWVKSAALFTKSLTGNIATKMQYDPITDRLYGVTSNGYLWRSTVGLTGFANDDKAIDITGMSGTANKQGNVGPYNGLRGIAASIQVNQSTGRVEFWGSRNPSTLLYVPSNNVAVTNNSGDTVQYRRYDSRNPNIALQNNSWESDGNMISNESKYLPAGYYIFACGNNSNPNISVERQANLDISIIGNYLYYTDSTTETLGGTAYSKGGVKYVNLSTWGTPVSTNIIARANIFLSASGTNLYTSHSNYTSSGGGYASYITKTATTTAPATATIVYTDTGYEIRELAATSSTIDTYVFSQQKQSLTDTTFSISKITGTTKNTTPLADDTEILSVSPFNVGLIKGGTTTVPTYYYILKSTMELNEINETGTVKNLESYYPTSAPTTYSCIAYVKGNSDGAPDCIIPITDTSGTTSISARWHAVIGNYSLALSWIATGANAIDTGVDSELLTVITTDIDGIDETTDNVTIKAATTPTASTYSNLYGMCDIKANETTQLEGIPFGTPGGTSILGLAGTNRYLHYVVQVTMDISRISDSTSATFLDSVPTVNSIVFNWVNLVGASTLPATDVTSAVHRNYYYLSFCEPQYDNKTNDINVNNAIFVLDRYKRWLIWRGNATSPTIRPAAMTVFNDELYWSDCYTTIPDINGDFFKSDWIVKLSQNALSDMFAYDGGTQQAIDAWYITKSFNMFAPFDSQSFKKTIRHAWVTAIRSYTGNGTPASLKFSINKDEQKVRANGIETDYWYTKIMNTGSDVSSGRITSRIDFPNDGPAYRYRFKVQNDQADQDLPAITWTVQGQIHHRRNP